MKCDRRILSVLAAILIGLAINQHFRSLFLFGARASTNQLTMNGMELVSTEDKTNMMNLGAWSLPTLPEYKETTRDQQLGSIICRTHKGWNQVVDQKIDGVHLIEEYCKSHPDDIAAHAHLVRLSVNLNSLAQTRDKELITAQATRMAKYAADCALVEPQNWYWRERQVHFLMLIGQQEKAEEVFTALPLPTMFEDYVEDEVRAKEAFYTGGYMDLPKAAMLTLWAETIYPHLSMINQFDQLIKGSKNPLKVRAADVEFGRSMVKSCPSMLAVLVGIRHVRRGLWDTIRANGDPMRQAKPAEEAKIAPEYLKVAKKSDWDQTLRMARENFYSNVFLQDGDLSLLYVGQLGPVFIASGVYAALFGLLAFGMSKTRIRNLEKPLLGWTVLFLAMMAPNVFWNSGQYLNSYSLGNQYVLWVFFVLIAMSLKVLRKADDLGKKVYLMVPIVFASGFGLLSPGLQATMIFFFVAFIMQRGKMPLGPWTTAIGMLVLGYQASINLAFAQSGMPIALGLIPGMLGIIAVSRRQFEPDQPRLAPLAIALGSVILGTFLVAQYDRGVTTYFESQLENQMKLKAKMDSLQFS